MRLRPLVANPVVPAAAHVTLWREGSQSSPLIDAAVVGDEGGVVGAATQWVTRAHAEGLRDDEGAGAGASRDMLMVSLPSHGTWSLRVDVQ